MWASFATLPELVKHWKRTKVLHPVLQSVVSVLVAELKQAGLQYTDIRSDAVEQVTFNHQAMLWHFGQWRLEGNATPFEVTCRLEIDFEGEFAGRVLYSTRLRDIREPGKPSAGVLGEPDIQDTLQLAETAALTDIQAWEAHVLRGLNTLTDDVVAQHIEFIMDCVNAVTTP
jgi:hypothetical protein